MASKKHTRNLKVGDLIIVDRDQYDRHMGEIGIIITVNNDDIADTYGPYDLYFFFEENIIGRWSDSELKKIG